MYILRFLYKDHNCGMYPILTGPIYKTVGSLEQITLHVRVIWISGLLSTRVKHLWLCSILLSSFFFSTDTSDFMLLNPLARPGYNPAGKCPVLLCSASIPIHVPITNVSFITWKGVSLSIRKPWYSLRYSNLAHTFQVFLESIFRLSCWRQAPEGKVCLCLQVSYFNGTPWLQSLSPCALRFKSEKKKHVKELHCRMAPNWVFIKIK